MASLSSQDVTSAGLIPTYAAATSAGDSFANDGKTMIHYKNGGTSKTITITSQVACNQGSTHNDTVALSSGGEVMIGPLDTGRYSDTSGNVQISYSAVTSLTVGVFQI